DLDGKQEQEDPLGPERQKLADAQAKLDQERAKLRRDREAADKRAAEEADKREKEVARALAAGRDLLEQKKYEEAIRELETALALDVGNKEVRAALAEARSGRDAALAAKKRADDYEDHRGAGGR